MSREPQETVDEELEKIDLMGGVYEMMGAFRKFWIPIVIAVLICGAAGYFYAGHTYVPMYTAYTELIVQAGSGHEGSYTDDNTVEQMGDTFSYVAKSGVLRQVVAKKMGVDAITSQIDAEVMSGSNIITISVTDADPVVAAEVLDNVIACYPQVTEYIVGPSTFSVFDESGVPDKPANECPYTMYTLAGVLLALLVSGLLLMIYSSRRKMIMNGEDLKDITAAKMLGNIPTVHMKKRSDTSASTILLDNSKIPSVFKEAIRLVRSRLDKEIHTMHLEHPVLLVTSSIPGEGKSMVAANLAIAIAGKGKRVALVDGDLRHPAVCTTLNITPGEGDMVRYLRGQCSEDDMKVRYKTLPLMVYTGKTAAGNAIGLIRSEEMRDFISGLKEEYDFVVIDTPPSSMLSDTAGYEAVADACVFVIRQDFTNDRQFRRALESVSDASIPVIGYVMNAVMEGTTGYGYSSYGYSQYGYRKYGYGYGYGSKGYGYGYGYGYGEEKQPHRRHHHHEEETPVVDTSAAEETPAGEAAAEETTAQYAGQETMEASAEENYGADYAGEETYEVSEDGGYEESDEEAADVEYEASDEEATDPGYEVPDDETPNLEYAASGDDRYDSSEDVVYEGEDDDTEDFDNLEKESHTDMEDEFNRI